MSTYMLVTHNVREFERVRGLALAHQRQIQLFPMFAHPADLPGRHADHQGIGGHVFVDDSAGADEGVFAYRHATDSQEVE